MEYLRTGRWPNIGVRCDFEFEYRPNHESVNCTLEVVPLGDYSDTDFNLDFPDDIIQDTPQGSVREFEIPPEFQGGEIFVTNTSEDNNIPTQQIDLVPTKVFSVIYQILEDESDVSNHNDDLKDIYSNSSRPVLMKFRADAEKVLEFDNYARLLSILADSDARVRSLVETSRYPYFVKRSLNPREPQYIRSFEDLLVKISCYNSHKHLSKVNVDSVLYECLVELFIRVESSGFDYVSEIVDRLFPETNKDFELLSKPIMSLYTSILIYSGEFERAKDFVWNWIESDRDRVTPFSNVNHPANLEKGAIIDFLFQVSFRRVKNADYEGSFIVFEAVKSATPQEEKPHQHDLAAYLSHLQRGYYYIRDSPSRARENFDEAIQILKDSNELDSGPDSEEYIRALDAKCKAVVSDYRDSENTGTAIAYLSKFIEQDLSKIEGSNPLHSRVDGLRHELIAQKYIQDRSLELAIDQFDDAISQYRSAGTAADEKQSLRLFIQQRSVSAYQLETEGEFGQAGGIYAEIATMAQEGLSSKNSWKAFKIRSHLCFAKQAILNKNTKEGRNQLQSISELGPALRENSAVKKVIDLFEDYQRGSISSSGIKPAKFSEERAGMMFTIETNYQPASSVLLAVQYIRQYGFEKDLLDPMVMLSLENCFIPRDIHEGHSVEETLLSDSEYSYLIELSTSARWQARLPSHIHYLIEQLKIAEVSTAGNYSALADQATKILELFLEVFGDYYSDVVDGLSTPKSTLNPLIDFIHSLPDNLVSNLAEVQEALKENVVDSEHIGNVRNSTHHGEKIHVDKEEYETIRDCVMEILQNLSTSCPIIVEVIDQNPLGPYLVAIHWGAPGSRSYVTTDAILTLGELYYLPSGSMERSHIIEVPESEIVRCTKERPRQAKVAGKEIFG